MIANQCCGFGSGAFLTPGSRIGYKFSPNLGSRIRPMSFTLGLKYLNFSSIDSNFCWDLFKKCKNFQLGEVLFMATRNVWQCFWVWDLRSGSEIWEWKNPDSGPRINIPDPQHCWERLSDWRARLLFSKFLIPVRPCTDQYALKWATLTEHFTVL